jgi:hypothetical protein
MEMKDRCRLLVVVMSLFGTLPLSACLEEDGGEDSGDVFECCMLSQIASHCDSTYATTFLQESVREWRQVANSGNRDACQAMIEGNENGCSGSYSRYDEDDAIVDCSERAED